VTVAIGVVTVGIVGVATVTVATGVLTVTVAATVGTDSVGTETAGGDSVEGNSDGAPSVVEGTGADAGTDPAVAPLVEPCADVGAVRMVPPATAAIAPALEPDALAKR
jgi:hypothetical protein